LANGAQECAGEQLPHGRRNELSQGRLTLSKVVVQKRQLVVAFDDAEEWSKDHDAAAQEEIDQPHSDDL
jgi:hypothetical protein